MPCVSTSIEEKEKENHVLTSSPTPQSQIAVAREFFGLFFLNVNHVNFFKVTLK